MARLNKRLFDRLKRDWATGSGHPGTRGFVATLADRLGVTAGAVYQMRNKDGYNKDGRCDAIVKKANKAMRGMKNAG